MSKTLIRQIDKHIELYKDEQNGLAWIEDGTTGIEHSCHPHIDGTGSVSGMKNLAIGISRIGLFVLMVLYIILINS